MTQIPEFDFADKSGNQSKRAALSWIQSRQAGRAMRTAKLFGFTKWTVGLTWKRPVLPLLAELLKHPTVLETIGAMDDGVATLETWQQQVAREYDQYEARREGSLPAEVDHYGYEKWHHRIDVSDDGTATHTIDCRLVNRTGRALTLLAIPVWVTVEANAEDLLPWVESSDVKAVASVGVWNENGLSGRIDIRLDPIPCHGFCSLKWGYTAPRLAVPGDSHYVFEPDNPTFDLRGEIVFSKAWRVENARVPEGHLSATSRRIVWRRFFPRHAQQRIEFLLTRA